MSYELQEMPGETMEMQSILLPEAEMFSVQTKAIDGLEYGVLYFKEAE